MSDAAIDRANRDELVRLLLRRAACDGTTATALPFLSLLRAARPSDLRHGVIEPSFCLIVQGGKQLQVGAQTYEYGAFSYVTSAIEFPTSGRITAASTARPYLAVRVSFNAGDIAAVIVEAKIDLTRRPSQLRPAVFVGRVDPPLLACVVKMLAILDEPDPAQFLGEGVRRELIYRLLRSEHGPLICRSVKPANLGIGRAIEWLRRHFDEPIDIVALAKTSRMSVSSLRHEFKAATAMAPLQFQKQLRLQEARRLMLSGDLDAGTAAYRVGYESQSQFTREYRRLFGAPPIRHVRSQRGSSMAAGEPGVMT
jgi:AraC-like DNA-binding protein